MLKSHAFSRAPSSIATWYSSGLSSPPLTIHCLITWPSNSANRGNAARRASATRPPAMPAATTRPIISSASSTMPCVLSQMAAPKYRIGPNTIASQMAQPCGHDQVFVSISSSCQLPR